MLRADIDLATLNARAAGRLPGLFGFRVTAVEQGTIAAELTIKPEFLAPNGYLHAATVIALADTACGYGCIAHMPDGAESFTTIELKSNFLGTARDGVLSCIARPAHLGRTTQVWDATVNHPQDGRAIALFRCTQMILWPRSGTSR
ncbi:MAG TPA: PaaI family thioesterase [Casimicrobiaceae bacterium]|nr:PaaI family thioesterase [Casimicrobiaceae bacterium]